jgi:hypothetical protein
MPSFDSIWASGPTDVWAAGASGLFHFDGARWTAAGPPSAELFAFASIWGSGSGDVWTSGSTEQSAGSTLFHWNGATWTVAYTAPAATLGGIWGASASDAWVVGSGPNVESDASACPGTGAMLHYDGTTWSSVPSGAPLPLAAVGGSSATDVWAAGFDGELVRLQ